MIDDLIMDADAKLAQNEIELLGCYDVHPEPYENDVEAPAARRAFLENLLAPFLACMDALTAERDRLREMIANVQRVREHEHRRAENAIAERDDAFIRGMAAGQAAMPTGTLTVIDGPELERAKYTIAALTARASLRPETEGARDER